MRAVTFFNAILLALNPSSSSIASSIPAVEHLQQHHLSSPSFPPKAIPEFVENLRQKYGVAGIGVGLAKKTENGWDEYAGHFGVANAQGDPVTEYSLFAIASNGKLFTMMAVGLLVENGTVLSNGETLHWHTKIKDILPDWKLMDEYASDHVDLIDLMSHRSGMPRHDHAHGPNETPAEVVASLRHLRPSYEIRQQWQYNNQHYLTLAHIVTTLSGIAFPDYVTQHILRPLNMTESTYNSTRAAESGHRTDAFGRTGRNVTLCAERWDGVSKTVDESCLGELKSIGWWTKTDGYFEAGAGGLIVSPVDIVKWVRELVDPKILPKSLVDLASTTVQVPYGSPAEETDGIVSYGLAQMAWTYRGVNLVGHGGSLAGQRSLLVRVPDYDFAMLVTMNDAELGIPLIKLISYKIVDELVGLSPVDLEEHTMGEWFTNIRKFPDAPENPNPPPPESDIAGDYHDDGYGSFSLELVERPDDIYTSVLPLNVTGPVYFAPVNKAFITHLVFTHWSGNVFNWTTLAIFPVVGKDGKPTEEMMVRTDETDFGSAIFDSEGVGLFGNFWGAEGDQARSYVMEDMVEYREKANVWFKKVKSLL